MPNHPLGIISKLITGHFALPTSTDTPATAAARTANVPLASTASFRVFDRLSPFVSTKRNFDDLLVPADHVSRRRSDTYYVSGAETVLRTHTSAHQAELLEAGHDSFLVVGDVYRRDEIDASHYPVFHQMEGVRVWTPAELRAALGSDATPDSAPVREFVVADLKRQIEGLVRVLFGDAETRWVDAYFPFTTPSFELEVRYQDRWLEVLGSGMIQNRILANAGRADARGWAFGLGLERLAMVLFQIPDIRLFWSQDARFSSQFTAGRIQPFQPYSKYPACYKDVSFWMPPSGFHENDLMEHVRSIAGDLVESVVLQSEFKHPKTERSSRCYRILYRSMDRNLTNEEIDRLQAALRVVMAKYPGLELR